MLLLEEKTNITFEGAIKFLKNQAQCFYGEEA